MGFTTQDENERIGLSGALERDESRATNHIAIR